MNECTALMVIRDKNYDNEQYMPVDMHIADGIMPENNPRDIMHMVNACNNGYTGSEDITFIDMYGIIVNNKIELWEDDIR